VGLAVFVKCGGRNHGGDTGWPAAAIISFCSYKGDPTAPANLARQEGPPASLIRGNGRFLGATQLLLFLPENIEGDSSLEKLSSAML